MMRGTIEAPMRAAGASEDDVLANYEATLGGMIGTADAAILSLHRHHLVETVRRQLDWGVEANPTNALDVVIGFADLTDSTRLVADLALDELDHALSVFEERTADVIAHAGATLVKRMGDAVMFVTPAAAIAAEIATELVRAFECDAFVPPVRVGLAAGEVVARRGDFYGLPVVLAARLVQIAEPATVLVSDEVERRLRDSIHDRTMTEVPPKQLAGFTGPTRVYLLAVD
jgi:adenylate cyclase